MVLNLFLSVLWDLHWFMSFLISCRNELLILIKLSFFAKRKVLSEVYNLILQEKS